MWIVEIPKYKYGRTQSKGQIYKFTTKDEALEFSKGLQTNFQMYYLLKGRT